MGWAWAWAWACGCWRWCRFCVNIRYFRRRCRSVPPLRRPPFFLEKGGQNRWLPHTALRFAPGPLAPVPYRGRAAYDLLRQAYDSRSSASPKGATPPPLPNTSTRPSEVACYGWRSQGRIFEFKACAEWSAIRPAVGAGASRVTDHCEGARSAPKMVLSTQFRGGGDVLRLLFLILLLLFTRVS